MHSFASKSCIITVSASDASMPVRVLKIEVVMSKFGASRLRPEEQCPDLTNLAKDICKHQRFVHKLVGRFLVGI